jgi:REP element-mobilizing transposase RayT
LLFLSSVFSIGICAYAVMSNHTHVVLCVDKDLAESWSMTEVIKRWHQMYQGTLLS